MALASSLLLVALLLAVLAAHCASEAAVLLGGASAAAKYVSGLISNFDAAEKQSVPDYLSTNSGDGIAGFSNGTYAVGVSDVPFSAAQEVTFKPKVKYTIPQAIDTFSFFTSSGKQFPITAHQVNRILTGSITRWGQLKAAKKKGLRGIIPVIARSDSAGTTFILTKFLQTADPSWSPTLTGSGPFTFGNPNIVYVKGSTLVAEGIKSRKNAFGFLQTGIGAFQYGLKELAIRNAAGKYVVASSSTTYIGDYTQAIPRVVPAASLPWTSVSLIWQPGAATYPIVDFLYTFYKSKYVNPRTARVVRKFGLYSQTVAVQNLAGKYYFNPLPSAITTQNRRALRKIK